MSNVIAFRVDRCAPPRLPMLNRDAEILLFTGIRYIRDDAEPCDTVAPPLPPCPEPLPLADDRLLA